MKFKVECPCCKGLGIIFVHSPDLLPGIEITTYSVDNCSHCEGTGEVEAEVENSNNSGDTR